MSHTSPPDGEALRGERQRLYVALRLHGGEALKYGVQHGFPDFTELAKRILAVVKSCQNIQNRSLEWTPSKPECYSFSGSPPYDLDAARLKAANAWRSQTCTNLVGQVQEAMEALAHVWIAIGPHSGPGPLASLNKPEKGKGGNEPPAALPAPDAERVVSNLEDHLALDLGEQDLQAPDEPVLTDNSTRAAGTPTPKGTDADRDGVENNPTAPAKDNSLTLLPGGFVYRKVEMDLSGKPLDILKALYLAPLKTLKRNQLVGRLWKENAVENSTVSNAISDARNALRAAMKRAKRRAPKGAKNNYPIVTINRGGGDGEDSRTAWRLEELP